MKCGVFKKDMTPPAGCNMGGKLKPRVATGVEDPLHIRAVAFEEDGLAIILCFDLGGMDGAICDGIRDYLAHKLGCETKNLFLTCTHTHTAPNTFNDREPKPKEFIDMLPQLALSAAQGAIADLKTVTNACGARSELPDITFTRRYRMKDGSVRTNPGRRNPDILEPMSPADETIRLLRFEREGGDEVLLVNFQVHPDVMNSQGMSADYPGVVCDTLERALPGTKCIYFNGTAGDLNQVDVHCPEWDPNSGPDHARHMGLTIAGKVMSMYTKARPIQTGPVRTMEQHVNVALRTPQPEKVSQSREYIRLHEAGLDEQIPGVTMMERITALFEAYKIVWREGSQDSMELPVCGLCAGDICFVTMPGEAFCDIGRQIREESPFAMQFTLGICNAYGGYFPTKDAFGVNGYEARTSSFQPGVGEVLMETGKEVAKTLYKVSK